MLGEMMKVALVALQVVAATMNTSWVMVLVRAMLHAVPVVNLVPLSDTVVPFLVMFSNLGLLVSVR
jgi:hypothetical protein